MGPVGLCDGLFALVPCLPTFVAVDEPNRDVVSTAIQRGSARRGCAASRYDSYGCGKRAIGREDGSCYTLA